MRLTEQQFYELKFSAHGMIWLHFSKLRPTDQRKGKYLYLPYPHQKTRKPTSWAQHHRSSSACLLPPPLPTSQYNHLYRSTQRRATLAERGQANGCTTEAVETKGSWQQSILGVVVFMFDSSSESKTLSRALKPAKTEKLLNKVRLNAHVNVFFLKRLYILKDNDLDLKLQIYK